MRISRTYPPRSLITSRLFLLSCNLYVETQKQTDASRTRATGYERQRRARSWRTAFAPGIPILPLCVLSSESFPPAAAGNGRQRLPQQPAAESAATSHGVNALTSGPGSAKMHTRATNLPPAWRSTLCLAGNPRPSPMTSKQTATVHAE